MLVNYNPTLSKRKLFSLRDTVKRFIPIIIQPQDTLPIKQINISDRDKFGDIVYKGSKGGGKEKSRKTYLYRLKLVKPNKNHYSGCITRVFNKPQIIGKLLFDFGATYRIVEQIF